MAVAEILFVVAGLLLGLAFQGGMLLFLIPFAVVSFVLACLNRPRLAGPSATSSIPMIVKGRATGAIPEVAPDLRSEFRNSTGMANEPEAALKVSQVWARANADVNKAMTDLLQGLKRVIPNANSLLVFSNLTNFKEWGIRVYSAESSSQIATDVKITETSGLLGQLFNMDVDRLLEGDLSGGKALLYYIDNPSIKSLVAVPILDQNKNRMGALVVDSLYPNAFSQSTAQAMTNIASTLFVLYYKSFISAKNYIGQHQFSILYSYQHKFFQTMSVKDIYRQIFDYVKQNIPFDRMMLLALDRAEDDPHKEREGHVV
jgi:hypothetical protein